ncbi:MAG: amidase [Pseudomonadota bacterium]
MEDTVNAFISTFTLAGAPSGPLTGKTFAAKDLYDIKDMVTGCGTPDWAATHAPAERTSPAVQMLLDAGATCLGKSHTDEIAYSLMGVNAHYGTPINTKAPDRIPGGSSSGSVAATAAGLVDIGLGSDTGGSVRMPASFCGVYGIRTTHGLIDLSDAMALAPSFDTVGWFARDPETLALAGTACGIDVPEGLAKKRLLIASDAMALTTADGLRSFKPAIEKLEDIFGAASEIKLSSEPLSEWREVFNVCQAAEVWKVHGEWVTATNPTFGPGVRERFELASNITPDMLEAGTKRRVEITKYVTDLLGDDGILILPSSPGAAPLRDTDPAALDDFRMASLDLLSTAGLCKLPQISLPVGETEGAPLGLSLLSGSGKDGTLMKVASFLG